jgi:hypothetical protein
LAASFGKYWILFIHSTSVYRGKVDKNVAMNYKFNEEFYKLNGCQQLWHRLCIGYT